MEIKELIIATNNEGKIKEINNILKGIELRTLKEVGINIEIEEDCETFEGNALKKARTIAEITGKPCLADDSGLCIEKLNNWPGVKTARFLGKHATQEERNGDILKKLEDEENRKAKVVTSMVLSLTDGRDIIVNGELLGNIAKTKKGSNGFGFDEIFELENGKTLAEISQEEKDNISSRKKALEKIKNKIKEL